MRIPIVAAFLVAAFSEEIFLAAETSVAAETAVASGVMVATATAVPAAESDDLRAFVCDSARSTVSYTAIHPFATVHGLSKAPACTVWVNRDTTEFRVRTRVPILSFKSGNGLRDSHVRKAVEAEKFPQVTFNSASVKPKDGKSGPYALIGQLEFHGVTHSVEMTAKAELTDGKAVIRGEFPVSLKEYGVTPPSIMMNRAKDSINLAYELVFELTGNK